MVFVDLETTGSDAQRDRITEIGVIEVGPDGIVEWDTMINPGVSIPPFIQGLTGITDAMVRGQPTFASIAEALAERLHGRLFVAHNARFDYGFLKSEFQRVGITFRADVLCTVRLSRALYPNDKRHGLDALIARFTLQPKARHRALADADLLWQFWQRIRSSFPAELIESAVGSLIKRPSLPAGLEETALDTVPDAAGVYLFHGDNDVPLYIGKSIHLRQRIGAHFSADHASDREMRLARSVRRVAWRETGGELGALLLEARLIKELQPLHNLALRRKSERYTWELVPGMMSPRLRSDLTVDFSHHPNLHGAFGSRGAALAALRDLAEGAQLCQAVLATDAATERGRPCFARQLRRCLGACVGAEALAAHRDRMAAALAPLRLARWPFNGAVAWRENGAGRAKWHVAENWCYLGCVDHFDEAAALVREPARFDEDTYRLLAPRMAQWSTDAVILDVDRPFTLAPSPAPVSGAATGAAKGAAPTPTAARPAPPRRDAASDPAQPLLVDLDTKD